MKRFFFLFFLLFLLLILLIGFLAFNLEFLLNKTFFKEKIKNYISQQSGYQLNYKKVHINLYKTYIEFEELEVKGKDTEIFIPKGRIDFSVKRLANFIFYPQSIYVKNPQIKIKLVKEEKALNYREIIKNFQKIPELFLEVKNGVFELDDQEGSKLIMEKINLKARHEKAQLLLEGNASSSFFKTFALTLKVYYPNEFVEASLEVKNLDISKFRTWHKGLISKTDFDFQVEVSYEKGKWNIGFSGAAPCFAFKTNDKPLVCGFFQGIFVGDKENFTLKVSPIDMKYPEIKGDFIFVKKEDNYNLSGDLTAFKWEEARILLDPYLDREVKEELNTRVIGGFFKNLHLNSTAKDIKKLLDVSNLNLSSEVEDGEVYIPEISLNLKEIKGYVSLEKGLIKFQGETKVNGALHGRVNELSLALFEKEPKISLVGAIEGEGDIFKTIGLSLTKELDFLRDWDLSGKLNMNLELEGKLASPQIKLSLQPEALKVHIPNLKHDLLLESGKINYQEDKIVFDSLKLSYDKSSLSIVKGEYIPSQDWLNFQLNAGVIYEDQTKEFLEKYPKIKEIYSKYNLSLKAIILDEAQYGGYLRVNEGDEVKSLFKALTLKGSLKDCSGIIPYLGENFAFYSPKLNFSLNKGLISLLNSKISLEDSPFELEGNFNLENFKLYLNGKGTLKEDILNKIESLFRINTSNFELKKPPIEIPTFKVVSTNDTLQFYGDVNIGQLKSNIEFWKEKDFTLKGEIKGHESNFKLTLKKKEDTYFVFYNGKAKIDEISEIATTPFFKKGSVEGEIEAEINIQDLKKWSKYIEEGDLKGLINYYLKKGFFDTQGNLRLNEIDFNISPNLVISGFLNFDPQGIKGKEIALKLGKGDIFGDIELYKEKEFLNVKGNLEIKNLDVHEYFKAKFLEIQREEPVKEKKLSLDLSELPLKGDLTLSIEKLTLPTLHTLQNLKGHILVKEGGIVSLVIPQINFCGLEFYAEYEKNPTFSYLFIDLPPTYGEFLDLFACAYPEEMPKTILEGPFKMEGFFYSDWEKSFLENSYGNFEIKSPKGYLYRAPLIIKVLGFLSPIDLFRGKVPNLENNLLPYEEIDFKGEFSNSYFTIDTLFLSAPGFRLFGSGPISLKDKKVTLTFLVSPFKTIDVIIEHIPYLNRFLLGKERMFIYLPLEVIGPYDNPTIVPLHPASIGKGLFRFIFKFFGIQEDFFKEKRNFEGFKKKELLEQKSGNSVRR